MMNPGKRSEPLLLVRNLTLAHDAYGKRELLLKNVSFSMKTGETLVILGESGSGKTLLSRAITRLFSPHTNFSLDGEVLFRGTNLLTASEESIRNIRKKKIRYVLQESGQVLNPLATVRSQLRLSAETPQIEEKDLVKALKDVGINDAEIVLNAYPHQLSVGMAQRIQIAAALLPGPDLLIADEPTSAVEASLRWSLLDLIKSARESRNLSLILITHDLEIARVFGDHVAIVHKGCIVELAEREVLFRSPLHPYTRKLLSASPNLDGLGTFLKDVSLTEHDASIVVGACDFSAECDEADETCKGAEPTTELTDDDRQVQCFHWK